MSQTETIQKLYMAFSQGDIPTILGMLSSDVDWEYGGSTTNVPWLQHRKGREGATEFFQALTNLEFTHFAPTQFFENGRTVLVLVDLSATVKKNGQSFTETDEPHIWHFNEAGEICKFRHRVDTFVQQKAWNT